jgi:hypothetical protein
LAGATEHKLVKIAIHYPDVMKKLVEIDKKVNENRKNKEPSYPGPLVKRKITLAEWYERFKKQTTLDDYINEYNSCQLGCMLE